MCWVKLMASGLSFVVASVYLRNKTGFRPSSDSDIEAQVSHISTRAASWRSASCKVILTGDINSDHQRHGQVLSIDPNGTRHYALNDSRRCAALDKMVEDVGLIRVDLTDDLASTPTRNAALGGKWHIDMIAVDDTLTHATTTIHYAHCLTVFSDHYPFTTTLEVTYRKPEPRPARYVYKSTTATESQWNTAAQRLAKELRDLNRAMRPALTQASMYTAAERQANVSNMVDDLSAVLHTVYRKTIGTKKVTDAVHPA